MTGQEGGVAGENTPSIILTLYMDLQMAYIAMQKWFEEYQETE